MHKVILFPCPVVEKKNGTFQDIAHPINNEMRKKIEDSVLDAFETELNKVGSEAFVAVTADDGADEFD